MDTKSPVESRTRSLFGKVKHLLRSPRSEKFSDGPHAVSEAQQDGGDVRKQDDRLSPLTPLSTEVYEALIRLQNESTPRVVVHSPHPIPVVEEEDASDDGTYRPTIRKRGSDTIRPSVSRPTTATSRQFTLHETRDAEVQAPDGDDDASLVSDERLAQLEFVLQESQAQTRSLEQDNEDLRRQLADRDREVEALQLELMISEKFIETIKQENRELLMDIATGGPQPGANGGGSVGGWGEADSGYGFYSGSGYGSDVPTRPTSVASSFDAASFLSSGAWSAPPPAPPPPRVPVPRTASGSSAPAVVSAVAEKRKTPEPFIISLPVALPPPASAPPVPAPVTHNHHRRATTTSISSSSSSSQHQAAAAPIPVSAPNGTRKLGPTRRDSITSLRRTSHSHTPTQPSPLALDAMTSDEVEAESPEELGDDECDGEGQDSERGKGERSASVLSTHGLPTPQGSSPALSRTSTLASSAGGRSPTKEREREEIDLTYGI